MTHLKRNQQTLVLRTRPVRSKQSKLVWHKLDHDYHQLSPGPWPAVVSTFVVACRRSCLVPPSSFPRPPPSTINVRPKSHVRDATVSLFCGVSGHCARFHDSRGGGNHGVAISRWAPASEEVSRHRLHRRNFFIESCNSLFSSEVVRVLLD